MTTANPAQLFVLQEFRLGAVDSGGGIGQMVAALHPRNGWAVPLMTSIDDPHDVATLRLATGRDPSVAGADADADERAALAPYVASWRPRKWYRPRVAGEADAPPRYYRMAVTESGINDVAEDGPAGFVPDPADRSASSPIGLLWIGVPVGKLAGLLVLVGHDGEPPFDVGRDRSGWPLPLSRELGVRIYEGVGSTIVTSGNRIEDGALTN